MFSVTGFASVAGGGGRIIPLPPFTSAGLSLAKAMSANRSKTSNAEISISRFFIGALRAGRDPRQHGPNGPMFGRASARLLRTAKTNPVRFKCRHANRLLGYRSQFCGFTKRGGVPQH